MNNRINVSELSAMLAIATGRQKKLCEDFITALFAMVNDELSHGESVRIKGFGTFKLMDVEPRKSVSVSTGEECEIPGHKKVIFVVARELASVVNAPFNAFEAVEIADELPTDTLDGDSEVEESDFDDDYSLADDDTAMDMAVSDDEDDNAAAGPAGDSECSDGKGVEILHGAPQEDAEDDMDVEGNDGEESESPAPADGQQGDDDGEEHYAEENIADPEEETSFWKRYKFAIGFVGGMLIGGLVLYSCMLLKVWQPGEESVTEAAGAVQEIRTDYYVAAVEDTVPGTPGEERDKSEDTEMADGADVATLPSDVMAYDTVSTTRYLTTIAKEHYGNFNLWPIIYDENSSILGHPDRIRPGTRVVVPPLSKYGIDPSDAGQIKKIKHRGVEIYAKFKTVPR